MPLRLTHFGASEVRATAELTSKLDVNNRRAPELGLSRVINPAQDNGLPLVPSDPPCLADCDATASPSPGCRPFAARR